MDEAVRERHGDDISRLLHAQLRANEYRLCYLEIEPDQRYTPFDSTDYIDLTDHGEFCLDALNERKAAIVARGKKPVAVRMSTLLDRVVSSFAAGELPRGLSRRPSDWAPLCVWACASEWEQHSDSRVIARAARTPPEVIRAVTIRSAAVDTVGDEKRLMWLRTPKVHMMTPRSSMIVENLADEVDDDDEQ